MALRVLLADESTSIKKVMQLALQDFNVEVKSVPIGLDVLNVARTFVPDIIFIDVLLQKRSGYDVCVDLRSDTNLNHLPIVLMWSGFMDLDESRLKGGMPDARLEKPFEAETLRDITKKLVPRLKQSPVEQYLRFPHLPNFEEKEDVATSSPQPPVEESAFQRSPTFGDEEETQAPQRREDATLNFDDLQNELSAQPPEADQVMEGFDFGDDEATIVLPPSKDETYMPEGLDFGDADDGFTHVPLSAIKQKGRSEAPAGMDGLEDLLAPADQTESMQDRIRQARNSGQLPSSPKPNSQHSSAPKSQPQNDFPQPPRMSDYDDLGKEEPEDESARYDLGDIGDDFEQVDEPQQEEKYTPQMDWEPEDLSKYKIDLPEIGIDDIPDDFSPEQGDFGTPELLEQSQNGSRQNAASPSVSREELQKLIKEQVNELTPDLLKGQIQAQVQEQVNRQVESTEIESIVRDVAAEAIEAAVWKIIPDIAERLVREELAKLFKNIDDSVGGKS